MKSHISYDYGNTKKEEKLTPEEKQIQNKKSRTAKKLLAAAMAMNIMGGYTNDSSDIREYGEEDRK